MSQPAPEPKLQLRIIPVTPLQQNCSLIWDTATKHAAFVDPGGDIDTLVGALKHFGLTLKRIWLTHGHLDHAGAAAELRERTGIAVEGPHRDDQFWLDQIEESSRRYGLTGGRNVTPDRYLEDGDTLELEGTTFGVAHTPGPHARSRRDLSQARKDRVRRRRAVRRLDRPHRFPARQPRRLDPFHHRQTLAARR